MSGFDPSGMDDTDWHALAQHIANHWTHPEEVAVAYQSAAEALKMFRAEVERRDANEARNCLNWGPCSLNDGRMSENARHRRWSRPQRPMCGVCEGLGSVRDGDHWADCERCDGSGRLPRDSDGSGEAGQTAEQAGPKATARAEGIAHPLPQSPSPETGSL